MLDKGNAALVNIDTTAKDESGEEVFYNKFSMFIRGVGGFGGDRGPKPPSYNPPDRAPDVVHQEKTMLSQALWFFILEISFYFYFKFLFLFLFFYFIFSNFYTFFFLCFFYLPLFFL